MIQMIVDSTCDLPDDVIKKYDIKILPLRVFIEGKEYLDKKTIQSRDVYSVMEKGIIPKTSQPAPKDIYDTFSECCKNGMDFIYLAFSSLMSGTCHLAKAVLKELKDKYSEINMEVIDSKGGSTGSGLVAMKAAQLCRSGQDFNIIVDNINNMTDHIEHIFTVPDLKWLIKGGRVGMAQGIIGNILDIKPVLHVNNGIMEVVKKVRGGRKALNTIVDILEEKTKDISNQVIGISYAGDKKIADEVAALIKKRLGYDKFIINEIGSVLGSYIGIGAVGVFFFNSEV